MSESSGCAHRWWVQTDHDPLDGQPTVQRWVCQHCGWVPEGKHGPDGVTLTDGTWMPIGYPGKLAENDTPNEFLRQGLTKCQTARSTTRSGSNAQ